MKRSVSFIRFMKISELVSFVEEILGKERMNVRKMGREFGNTRGKLSLELL